MTRPQENAPLSAMADASGSSDPDGSIVSYRFDFGDGTIVGPQAAPTAVHVYNAGTWTATVAVTDNNGVVRSASTSVIVAAVPPEPNLVLNPSFEQNTTGWSSYNSSIIQRVSGGVRRCLRAADDPRSGHDRHLWRERQP